MSFESINPTTGETLGRYPEHTDAEVDQRLQSAWDGWIRWSRTPLVILRKRSPSQSRLSRSQKLGGSRTCYGWCYSALAVLISRERRL